MFDSLDERMKRDDSIETTPVQRVVKWAAVTVVSVLIFGGLYMVIQMME